MSFLTPNSGPIFHFAFTSTEITTPITAPFADIPPSELRSGCFYFSHQRVLFFCFSLQINIYPKGAWLSPSYFPLSYPESKSYEPRNNGKQHCRTNTGHRAFPLALQRCPIVYCLSFISFSPFFFHLCVIAYYFEHAVWEVQNLKTAPSPSKWGARCRSPVLWVKV